MKQASIPIPLTKAALRLIPLRVLSRLIDGLMIKIGQRHPKLFKNLALLAPATIHFEPQDLPHSFALKIEKSRTTLKLLKGDEKNPDASIKGKLKALLDMLEGRVDGDKMFFSRDFTFTGNTELVVALRNTLDREEIMLTDEITSLCGPFAKPAERAINIISNISEHIKSTFPQKP